MKDKIKSKTFIKNDRRFLQLFSSHNKEFYSALLNLRENVLGLPRWRELTYWSNILTAYKNKEDEGWLKIAEIIDYYEFHSKEVISNLKPYEKDELERGIYRIMHINKLGEEWYKPLLYFLLWGLFVPPFYNFSIVVNEEDQEVSIKVNNTTSFSDIKEGWRLVTYAQKQVFKTVKRNYVTNKSIENLILYLQQTELKEHNKKLTDLDIVGKLFKNEKDTSYKADTKRANRIRQIKQRLKK